MTNSAVQQPSSVFGYRDLQIMTRMPASNSREISVVVLSIAVVSCSTRDG